MGGMAGLLLLLWVGVTVSTAVNLQKRIIGGHVCKETQRQYHVRLIFKNNAGTQLCGGSLISERWILTAAHCNGRNMRLYLGQHPTGQKIERIDIIERSEIFSPEGKGHDLKLLKIPETYLSYLEDSKITPVKLPDCKKPPQEGTLVQVAGYAATHAGPGGKRVTDTSHTLQCAYINVVNCAGFRNTLVKYKPEIYLRWVHQHWGCFQTHGVDTCTGDSGGGVIYNDMIYGVIAFTGNHTHACVEPGAFMDICNTDYNKWIHDTIKK